MQCSFVVKGLLVVLTVSDSTCTLERGLCTWSNTQNMNRDSLDWELTSSELEKHYPVPHEDHTLGTERGKRPQHDLQRINLCYCSTPCFKIFIPSFVQVTSCSCQAATEQQSMKTHFCSALTCPQPKAPASNSGLSCHTHVRFIAPHLEFLHFHPIEVKQTHILSNKCSGQLTEGVDDHWRTFKAVAGVEWSGGPMETLWH